jgi:hypothetical protein
MKFEIFTNTIRHQFNFTQKEVKLTNNEMSKIEDLKKKEYASVSGGPQVENDPSIG